MTWIFEKCNDPFGKCIRQYCSFAATFLTLLLCFYALAKTIINQRHNRFQIITMIINTLSTLALLCTLSQVQSQDIYLIMQVIQMYSYSLLTYTYIGLYLLGIKKISSEDFMKFRMGFVIFSICVLITIVILICLEIFIGIPCHRQHGLGTLILSLLQIPLYIIALIFVTKAKKLIKSMQQSLLQPNNQQPNLLNPQDKFNKIKYHQANLMIFSFTLSIVIHFVTVIMFFQNSTSCFNDRYIRVTNAYDVVMFALYDFTSLLPHITIPLIIYVLPAYHSHDDSSSFLNVVRQLLQMTKIRNSYNTQNQSYAEGAFQQKIKSMVSKSNQKLNILSN